VLLDLGVPVQTEAWTGPPRNAPREAYVRLHRRQLCLPVSAEPEVDRLMGPMDGPRPRVTLWWDV
jgi:hypothetical protein